MRGHCPECERAELARGREDPRRPTLRQIHPSGEPTSRWGSAQWNIVEHHSDGAGNLCPGSGARI